MPLFTSALQGSETGKGPLRTDRTGPFMLNDIRKRDFSSESRFRLSKNPFVSNVEIASCELWTKIIYSRIEITSITCILVG